MGVGLFISYVTHISFQFNIYIYIYYKKDGTAINMWTLPDSRRLAYIEKQNSFVDYGVVNVCLKAIATHPSNVEDNLADEVYNS
jgi:hypothetical protein